MTRKSVFALAAILALGCLSLATDASAEHGCGGRGGGGHIASGRFATGHGPGPPLWLGVDPDRVYMSRQDIAPTYLSPADTAAISGMAVGGITALARAGYGRTTTMSTYGPAAKDRQCYFIGGLKPTAGTDLL